MKKNTTYTERFTIDFISKKIIGTQASFNKASKGTGEIYEELASKIARPPNFEVAVKEQKTHITKAKRTDRPAARTLYHRRTREDDQHENRGDRSAGTSAIQASRARGEAVDLLHKTAGRDGQTDRSHHFRRSLPAAYSAGICRPAFPSAKAVSKIISAACTGRASCKTPHTGVCCTQWSCSPPPPCRSLRSPAASAMRIKANSPLHSGKAAASRRVSSAKAISCRTELLESSYKEDSFQTGWSESCPPDRSYRFSFAYSSCCSIRISPETPTKI